MPVLPKELAFASPIYIHSHSKNFYTTLAENSNYFKSRFSEVYKAKDILNNIIKKNIDLLDKATQAYYAAGLNTKDLIQTDKIVKEMAYFKQKSTDAQILGVFIKRYRDAVDLLLRDLVNDPRSFLNQSADGLWEKLATDMANLLFPKANPSIVIGSASQRDKNLLETMMQRYKKLSQEHKGILFVKDIFYKDLAKRIATYDFLEIIAPYDPELAKYFSGSNPTIKQVREEVLTYMNNLDNIKSFVFTTDDKNITDKINSINKLCVSRGKLDSLIGQIYEVVLWDYFKSHPPKLLLKEDEDSVTIDFGAINLMGQSSQLKITTDLDLGLKLRQYQDVFSLGISAKTSKHGFTLDFDPKRLSRDKKRIDFARGFTINFTEDLSNFLYYIIINNYALQQYDLSLGTSSNLYKSEAEDFIKILYIFNIVDDLLGTIFIQKDLTDNPKSLLEHLNANGSISLPLLLSFPDKVIPTIDILKQLQSTVDSELQSKLAPVFDQIPLSRLWSEKQKILTDIEYVYDTPVATFNDPMIYQELYSHLSQQQLLYKPTTDIAKWFKFTSQYNSNWINNANKN